MIFDEWVTSDGNPNAALGQSPFNTLSYKINGGITQTIAVFYVADNFASVSADVTANDGFLALNGTIPVLEGQTLTILNQSLTFIPSGPGFNTPPATFTGNVFPADAALNSLSAIPEPTVIALCVLGSFGFLRRKH